MVDTRWRLTRRWPLIAVAALTLLFVGRWHAAYLRGMLNAWSDHAHGQYRVKTYGYVMGWEVEYRRLLRDRYGVEVKPEIGCLVTADEVQYMYGYNAVSRPRLQARFGRDIFAEYAREARTAWRLSHPGD